MACRPVFVPSDSGPFVRVLELEFEWHPGLAVSQAQKSIDSLHEAAAVSGVSPILEVSTKARDEFGRGLSAFRVSAARPDGRGSAPLECVFQAAKVFQGGGPFTDLLELDAREAKRDSRLRESGALIGFRHGEDEWPLDPTTAFYDWLYLSALLDSGADWQRIVEFAGFTDISFNPKKSVNCQARSVALGVALFRRGSLREDLSDPQRFRQDCYGPTPGRLF